MKRKIILSLIILIFIFAIIFMVCNVNGSISLQGAYIPIDSIDMNKNEYKMNEKISTDDIIGVNNGEKISLQYTESIAGVDFYETDLNGNKVIYSFKNGKFSSVGIYPNELKSSTPVINVEQAEQIANDFINKRIKNVQNDYTLTEKEYYKDSNLFIITYAKRIGEFNTGDTIVVKISNSGEIEGYFECNIGKFDDIDVSKFDIEKIKNNIINEVKEKYKEKEIQNVEVKDVLLTNYNGNDVFMVTYSVRFGEYDVIANIYHYVIR